MGLAKGLDHIGSGVGWGSNLHFKHDDRPRISQGLQTEKGVSEDVFLVDQQPNSARLNIQRNIVLLVGTGLVQVSCSQAPSSIWAAVAGGAAPFLGVGFEVRL